MIIRKLFKFEAGHVVRNCNSIRCKKSEHGHSYKVEVFFTARQLTDYGMVIDFGDLKDIKKQVDMFDHAYHFWNKESEEFKNFHKKFDERWVELPFNPSAENYSIYFLKLITEEIERMKLNGELDNKLAYCSGIRVHETDTGYAESSVEDLKLHDYYDLEDLTFGQGCFNS